MTLREADSWLFYRYAVGVFNRGCVMNKKELAALIAQDTGLTKKDASNAIDSVFRSIVRALRQKHPVRLMGFGTFRVESEVLQFLPSSELKRYLCPESKRDRYGPYNPFDDGEVAIDYSTQQKLF